MIDGNISMEEDTELRDLVVQTLENNGVLAKMRAELRASIFLTLEEQESVLNPEPFLNKPVKQYLASSEGKLLFSLVREFLEYFGLDYTISVYDPETYNGKEYNYVGRKKLCEELGINSKEPLLGEILKNTITGALNKIQKNDSNNVKLDKSNEISDNPANATFDVSVSKVLQKNSNSVSLDISEKIDNNSSFDMPTPINVTITGKEKNENVTNNKVINNSDSEALHNKNTETFKNSTCLDSINTQNNKATNETELKINHNKHIITQMEVHQNQEMLKSKKNTSEYQTANNVKNKNNTGKTVFFDEIIVDGMKENITGNRDKQFLLGELPPLLTTNNSICGDLPLLNDKKANINDLKELMDIAQGVSEYEEDFTSTASGSKKKTLEFNTTPTNSLEINRNEQEITEKTYENKIVELGQTTQKSIVKGINSIENSTTDFNADCME